MRRVFRKLKERFKANEAKRPLLKRVVIFGYGKVRLLEEYDKMLAWADDNNAKPSLLRYNNWIHKAVQWKEERSKREPDETKLRTALDYEEKRSKERLEKFRAGRI